MGKPHTIIGAERFHFRVRDGIGWFPLAMAARQTISGRRRFNDGPDFGLRVKQERGMVLGFDQPTRIVWVLYGQVARAISTG